MMSEINAAIKRNDVQQVKVLVEAVIDEVSYFYFSSVCVFLSPTSLIMIAFLIAAHKYI